MVFLYADDLGYGDLACYGSPVAETPRLDRFAREGTRFMQFYVSNCVCSPTRASAITGHFPSRHRIFSHIAFFEMNRERNMPDWLERHGTVPAACTPAVRLPHGHDWEMASWRRKRAEVELRQNCH